MPMFKIYCHGHAFVEADSVEEAERQFWFEDIFRAEEIDMFEEVEDSDE